MKRIVCLTAFLLLLVRTSFAQDLFDIKPMADGVYAAIAKPTFILNCNAAFIVLDDCVMVVDTHSKPSAARGLMEQIKKITDKPVRYVVNTHFHWDHSQGNAAYPNAWPGGVEIISSIATRDNIEKLGIPRMKTEVDSLPARIAVLKTNLANATDPQQKASIQNNLAQAEGYFAELRAMQVTLPTLTVDRSLVLHRKSKTVQILWLGKAHTDGDVWVYLPQDKVLICGDAMQTRMPFMGDSYPAVWVNTIAEVEKLDFTQSIGGHGEIMQGKQRFAQMREYFRDLVDETAKARFAGANLEDAQKQVGKVLVEKYTGLFGSGFASAVNGHIARAYETLGTKKN